MGDNGKTAETGDAGAFWRRDRHADRRPFLLARGRVKAALRLWFAAEDFIEVECGALQVSPGNEAHIHAFASAYRPEGELENGGASQQLYLHTSPEFACKKLLAAGEKRIVDFARVYRNGEVGPLHSPEFTMVEWYRAGASYTQVMDDTLSLCRAASRALERDKLIWRGRECDPFAEPQRISVTEAFSEYAKIDLDAVLDDRDGLADAVRRTGLDVRPGDNWSDLFSRVIVTLIEPRLGDGRVSILYNYPLVEAALARPCTDNKRYAERFEVYACGVELANGFGELTNVGEQRRRFESEMSEKERIYGERYPIDEDFLAALHHMPEASGVALGFDRLVMLAAGARHINDVLWTPFPVGS